MTSKREEHGLTIGPDRKLYAVGGFDGRKCLASAERYDPQTNTWEEIAPLRSPRRSLCAVALADGIYALGGYDGEKYLDSVERYDAGKNQWVPVPRMGRAKCTMAAVTTSDCRYIFVIGGYDGNAMDQVERYDVVHGCWELVCPMRHRRFMHAAAVSSVTN